MYKYSVYPPGKEGLLTDPSPERFACGIYIFLHNFLQLVIVMAPQPFQISVPDSQITDLKTRLSLATFPSELDEAGWDYGAPLADVKRLTAYWRDQFDWRKAEQRLNDTLPQFTTDISVDNGFGTLKVHFVHKRSEISTAIPLLFIHGCMFKAFVLSGSNIDWFRFAQSICRWLWHLSSTPSARLIKGERGLAVSGPHSAKLFEQGRAVSSKFQRSFTTLPKEARKLPLSMSLQFLCQTTASPRAL